MNTKPIIEIDHVTSGYNEHIVLDDISLQVFAHEVLVILGTSGCGKTTLLKHMIGLMKTREGRIKIFDRDLLKLDELEYNRLLKKIGVLFQNGALLNSLPLYANISIPLEQHTNLPPELMDDLVRLKLKLVGLEEAYHLLPSQLSGGMRKRAALARAIILDPQILFADEPGAGLDPVTSSGLDHLLLSLKEKLGMTLVIVSHEVESIKRIADRVVYLHEGKALFVGSLQEALQSDVPEVYSFFNS
jgi:phospholipid/cholesterol/gamma-HCH transport system ATP-binding protein